MNLTAIVPMRHISERIPGKNYRIFRGKPLFHYILQTLKETPIIQQIIVDTDSKVIREDIDINYPEIQVLNRPEHLRGDRVPMNDILLQVIDSVPAADFYLQTHATNPPLSKDSIVKAVSAFQHYYPVYDSLFSVTRLQTRLWDSLTRAINHNPHILLRTQDLPPVYEENSCLYIFSRKTLIANHNRLGSRPMMWEIPVYDAWDIDEEIDFRIAEFLHQDSNRNPGNI
jgi:CMP-N-acetylneuraminic acid synthetase